MDGWIEQRIKESRGFVSGRIVQTALLIHSFLYGESFSIRYQKGVRVIHPEKVIINNNKGLLSYICQK